VLHALKALISKFLEETALLLLVMGLLKEVFDIFDRTENVLVEGSEKVQ